MLTLSNVSLTLNNEYLIKDFSAEISAGKVLAVMGPSGVGKSSLLAYVSGTLAPEIQGSGSVTLVHTELTQVATEQRQLGLLQQAPLLFPHLSVMENVLFAIPREVSKSLRRDQAKAALASVGLEQHENKLPEQLSGGQQARLALIRTLSPKPQALLLDEPFSKLDKALRQDMRELVMQAVCTHQIPAILVTHDEDDARAMAFQTSYLSGASNT